MTSRDAPHDDCVDALSGAHQALSHGRGQLRSYVPRGNIYEFGEGPAKPHPITTIPDPDRATPAP